MTVTHAWGNVSPLLQLEETEPLSLESWASRFTLDDLVAFHLCMWPKLQKIHYRILHEFVARKYNKINELMEKGTTTNEDDSAKDVEEPLICAICSDECKKTEERSYFNCGHTYHWKCIRPVWKLKSKSVVNCLACGQELLRCLRVPKGQSTFWRDN